MQLGAFSISLSVKDIQASRAFYEKLGFSTMMPPEEDATWMMLKNGDTVIGLFQGMFEGNLLTFNPGWDQSAQNSDPFTDVRKIAAELASQGVELMQEAGLDGDGVGSFAVTDPDGNVILIDQHRPKPG